MKNVLYFDDNGNAIGLATITEHQEKINSDEVTQTISAGHGGESDRMEEIDQKTFDDIKNPDLKTSLKDFKIDKASNPDRPRKS